MQPEDLKCREWERERRNRFNEACAQLGELVKEHTADDTKDGKNRGNLAKIEIILSAVTLIRNLLRDKSQLDSNLLAVQAKLQSIENTCHSKKDAATQICKDLQTINKGSMKRNMFWKETGRHGKHKLNRQKENAKPELWKATVAPQPNLPKLLPKSKAIEKKDKAVVVLPAAPYILPRSIFLPPATPTFVLLESYPMSRNNIPIMPRVVSEITKTTMVNNLPIAAYSYPLSLARNKKTKVIDKVSLTKKPISAAHKRLLKVVKKSKKLLKNIPNEIESTKEKKLNSNDDSDAVTNVDKKSSGQTVNTSVREEVPKESPDDIELESLKEGLKESHIDNTINKLDAVDTVTTKNKTIVQQSKDNIKQQLPQCNKSVTSNKTYSNLACENNKSANLKASVEVNEKNKIDKIPPVLDSNLCDNTVDGGNARLELAEEFLAASPTAAFLMTFPLVSGMRAETPPDYEQNSIQTPSRPIFNQHIPQKRNHVSTEVLHNHTLFGKSSEMSKEQKIQDNAIFIPDFSDKTKLPDKHNFHKSVDINQMLAVTSSSGAEHSFLNFHAPSVLNTTTAPTDTPFSLDFEATFNKNTNAGHAYVNSSNFILKNDPFSQMKNNNLNMYSGNNIPSSHDFNAFGLYPCAVEKYSNKMPKTDYANADDNFMKIGSSRVTYDLDLGLPQKPYELMSTANNVNNLNKENIFTPVTTAFSSSYNPFNPEFHMPLVTSSASMVKKTNKSNVFYTDTITNLYSQPSTLWPEEINMYGNNNMNIPKLPVKQQGYPSYSNQSVNASRYSNSHNVTDNKTQINHSNATKSSKLEINQLVQEKITKKPPNKTHINWMTSEIRPMQSNTFDTVNTESKDMSRIQYTCANSALGNFDYNGSKKQDFVEPNFFPISMPNISSQPNQDDIHLWAPTRPLGTAEICLDPPPINLPTLVGDLALGPHERRKSVDRVNRGSMQPEPSNCNNFLSVTQLMNRSSDSVPTGRFQGLVNENQKSAAPKYNNLFTYPNTLNDKPLLSHINTNNMQPCYFFNDPKPTNAMGNVSNQTKPRSHKLAEKNSKSHKNNYSAEALLKGANSTQKLSDNLSTVKFSSQKYPEYNPSHNGQVAQVSHYPGVVEYPDNNYSGTSLYNSTTNTVSNSFYTNFMPASTGIMSANYNTSNFAGDFIEYTPSSDCNFTYPRFDNFKIKDPPDPSGNPKFSLDLHKSTQKDSLGKHKADYSKKDLSKNKYQSKRPKVSAEIEDWTQVPGMMLQNKNVNKKYPSTLSEDMTFANYIVNPGPTHSHHMPDILNCAPGAAAHTDVGAAPGRLHGSFPYNATRTNFNLSTLFPEIAKKVQ